MARFTLLVTDTSPLITLALADALDLLLRPGLDVSIPDAVFIEATRVRGAPGADRIVDWINTNDAVRITPTAIGVDLQRRLDDGRSIRGMGELAAYETLNRFAAANPEGVALLLFEDNDIAKRRPPTEEQIYIIGTGNYLRALEAAGLLQSADYVLDEATVQGRNVERQRNSAGNETAALLAQQLVSDRDRRG